MPSYYLDLETNTVRTPDDKIDFNKSQVISIAYRKINTETGDPIGDLNILKAWETNESYILNKFLEVFNPFDEKRSVWHFVPVGFNLSFDFLTLLSRWYANGVKVNATTMFRHPNLDIQPVVVMFNHGIFKGATLGNFSTKQGNGGDIKALYEAKDYKAIEEYITLETDGFFSLYKTMVNNLPEFWKQVKL
jgi:hypothetical protein